MTSRFALMFAVICAGIPCEAQELQQQVRKLMETKYRDVAVKAQEMAMSRRFGEGHKLWLSAVPYKEKTVADYFLLGNTFLEAQPKKALEFHRRAAKLSPDVPDVQLELGMALHRNSKYKEAAKAYKAYLNSDVAKSRGPGGAFDALLADCLVRTGEYEAACDAWERVPFRSYRIKIAKYAHIIHGKRSPLQRHYELLTAARKKDLDAAARTLLLDCNWDWDWWSVEVKRDFLKSDIAEFKKLFPADDPRMILMNAIADYRLKEPTDDQTQPAGKDKPAATSVTKAFLATLKSNNLILGKKPTLPNHGLLVSHAVNILIQNDLAKPADLLKLHKDRFEAELQKNAAKPTTPSAGERTKQSADEMDLEMVNVYASLLAQAESMDELQRVDRAVWKKANDAKFAVSYLFKLLRDGKGENDPEVAKIMKDFADHKEVRFLTVAFGQKNKRPLSKPMADAIAAEFEMLTVSRISGVRTSDRLRTLFSLLRGILMIQAQNQQQRE